VSRISWPGPAGIARRLLDDTDLTVLDVAFRRGFGSLRQFNRTWGVVPRVADRLRHRSTG